MLLLALQHDVPTFILERFLANTFQHLINLVRTQKNMATLSPTGPDNNDIFTGFWINRSYDAMYGATLTLDRQGTHVTVQSSTLRAAVQCTSPIVTYIRFETQGCIAYFPEIFGRLLTFAPLLQGGGLLIAFLALYVSYTGTHFWKISRLVFHYSFSSRYMSDGVYHQRQAILRNSESGSEAFWALLQASVVWKKRAKKLYRRTLPVITYSLIISIAFPVAGTISA